MYLPNFVRLSPPYIAHWRGKSGKSYEFGVTDPEYGLRDGPAVAVLVQQRPGGEVVPLWVGCNTWDPSAGWRLNSEAVRVQARTRGATHMHVRFEAYWDGARTAEVEDLIAALDPPLNSAVAASAPMERSEDDPAPRRDPVLPAPVLQVIAGGRDRAVPGAAPATATVTEDPAVATLAAEPRVADRVAEQRRPSPFARLGATIERWLGGWRATAIDRTVIGAEGEPPAPPSMATEPPTTETRTAPPPAVDSPPSRIVEPVALRSTDEAVRSTDEEAAVPAKEAAQADAVLPVSPSGEPAHEPQPRRELGLPEHGAVVLFAGEMAHATGVDILVEAVAVVAGDRTDATFVFAGEGSLKAEMQARAGGGGFADRCRFLGHLDSETFAQVLAAADIVVVPAREPQDPALVRRALAAGRWVLATHQARIDGIDHGRNGLVTYDNPGSIVWGVRELLARTAQGGVTDAERRAA